MKRTLFVILTAIGFANTALAQDKDTMRFTLAEAKAYALAHSKDLTLQGYEIEKADLKVKESLSYLLPQVNGDLSYTRYGKLNATIIPENTFGPGTPAQVIQFGLPNNVNVGIKASQTIFNGVFFVGLRAAEIYTEMIRQEKEVKSDDILYNVTKSYYNALIAASTQKIIAQNIKNLETILYQTQQLYKNGLVEEIDVNRLELSLSNLKTQVSTLEKQTDLTELVLKFQMGFPLDQPISLAESLDSFLDETPILFPENADFNNREEMKLMDLRTLVNQVNVKRLKSGYLPSLTAFGSLASSAQRQKFDFLNFGDDKLWFNVRYFGVQLNVPIWDSFGRKAQINTAKVDIKRIQTGKELMEEGYVVEYNKARIDYMNAQEELANAQKNIALAEKIYKVSQLKYKEGIGSSIELTTAEQQLYTTQANLLNAIYKVIVAKADINKALGTN